MSNFTKFKISNLVILASLFFYTNQVLAIKIPKNKYGLQVVKNLRQYKKLIVEDSTQELVLLSNYLKQVENQWFYASKNNFTKKVLYKKPHAYMVKEAAIALQKIQDSLIKTGLDILIFDAYRPYSVTKKMWKIVPDDRYAANPAGGSGHNRGVSIDISLVDFITRKEISMPTNFDNFSDTSHYDFTNLPDSVIANREKLKGVMEFFGFKALSTEWWHFGLQNPKRYYLKDLSFRRLKR